MIQALIAAGGKGDRLGMLARRWGNKSLVPLCGRPAITHTVDWLEEVGVEEIILTVNYEEERQKLCDLFGYKRDIVIITNPFRDSSTECVPAAAEILADRFLFLYGHAPAPPEHLRRVLSIPTGVVVSLFSETTQHKDKAIPTSFLEGDRVCIAEQGLWYSQAPYILNQPLVELLRQTRSWRRALTQYQGPIYGVASSHPSEFHYLEDYGRVSDYIGRRMGIKINTGENLPP